MGISQKIKAAMKLLKEIAHEYAIMTRKNKCIPGTKKRGRMSKKGTKKSVRFNKPLEPVSTPEPVSPVEPSAEPEEPVQEEKPVQEPVELSEENPFEQSMEPEEETETETNPVDDWLTETNA
jgi:hypothetical protein